MARRASRTQIVIIGVVLLVLVGIPRILGIAVEWLWFGELGFQSIYSRELTTRILLFVGTFVIAAAVLFANLKFAQRGVAMNLVLGPANANIPPIDVGAVLRNLTLPVALGIAFLMSLVASSAVWDVLKWMYAVPFGATDPVFGRDIGYYMFTLPIIGLGSGMLLALTAVTFLTLLFVYVLRQEVLFGPKMLRVEPSAALHLGILLATGFVILAARIWFVRIPNLLFSTTGPLLGASYTDLNAALPAMRGQAVFGLVAAALVLFGAMRQRLPRFAILAIAGFALIGIFGVGVVPAAMQRFVVAPNELVREIPQLEHHIAATRRAWDLDRIEVRDITGDSSLTLADIRKNSATIENVRLWDRGPLLETFGAIQEIRTYYEFQSVDDDRYMIDGHYRQVLLSPRELSASLLPTRNFINEHLTYTHGMGLTLSPVNEVTSEGLPVLFIKDLPPAATGSLKVTRPQLYYGELVNEYVIAPSNQREFDYPFADSAMYTRYAGTGGVSIGSAFRRALFAAHFGSMKILLSDDATAESRILYRRNILERARLGLPFLRFDVDPYMVIADDGTLHWMLDGYTTSSHYPYAQRFTDGVSYMRNSVKVLIDAYNGTVRPFIADSVDPVLRTYDQMFPGILRPLSEMPADLRTHIRYPEELYRRQAELYSIYHMDDPATFYSREDLWQIPQAEQRERQSPFMRHIIMRLPDEQQPEFIFMIPFTPRSKDNLAAWLVARNDGENYGNLRVYRFPRQSLVYGPRQIENRINQETVISQQLSLWDRSGSRVIRGDLLVIPIEKSLIYVQPIYLQAEGGKIPELKRVVVTYQNRLVMEETLDEALTVMFGGAPGVTSAAGAAATAATERVTPPTVGTPSTATAVLVRRAREHYDAAIAAQRAGDWSKYGQELARLGEILRQLSSSAPPP